MAIFRVTSRTWNRQAAKATVRYITHRREKDEKTQTRELFGRDGEGLTKYQAYRMIDKAKGNTTFFRMVISPDPKLEDTRLDLNLKTLTEMTMIQLQDRFPNQNISYIAAVHTNTGNRHVHILAMIQAKRIPKADLKLLRDTATNEARQQRQEADRDIAPSRSPQPPAPTRLPRAPIAIRYVTKEPQPVYAMNSGSWIPGSFQKERRVSPARMGPSCPNCGPFHEMERYGRRFECPSCGLRLNRSYGFGIEIDPGHGLGLFLEGVGEP